MSTHVRPTAAKWSPGASLSTRLSLFVALIVTGVVTAVAFLEVRSSERDIDRELRDAARLTAQSVAENLAVRQETLDPLDVRDTLHDLVAADPVIDAIVVIQTDETGHPRVFTSTSTEERAEVLDLAKQAIATKAAASERGDVVMMFALPVPRRGNYAVVVTVGLDSLLQARSRGLRIALGLAVPTILIVTILVHFTVRRFLGRPLAVILGTMAATADGDWRARATILRRDELGVIASGLNAMLDQLESFNQSLQGRIEEATRDLSLRNAQLVASQNQMFVLRESLARAERVAALGQVAANVAHQAGTPLNLVSGYVQMIRDDPSTDDRTRTRLHTVDTQIQQVTRVLRTLLDHARRPAGFETTTVADIVERVRDIAAPRLALSHIRLETAVADNLPSLKADATQLEMALLNLVTNALDAMPAGGTLSIAATVVAEGIRLEVTDTGPGLPLDIIDRAFEPWVTTKPLGQGSGIGLAIVRDVVRTHGGTVSAQNRSTGAAIVIDLPAADCSEERLPQS